MRISNVNIKNFRSIRECNLCLSPFGCIIGENNSGKSTVLLALSSFFTGTRLSVSDFYNPLEEIRIEVTFSDITEKDLNRLYMEHRGKLQELIFEGKLTFVRLFQTNGSACEYLVKKLMPKDERFDSDVIGNTIKGKKGKEIFTAIGEHLPEYAERFCKVTTQSAAKELIDNIISELPIEHLEWKDAQLPTGISNSVKNFLPEPVLIPAVLDISDEVKTKDSATFGKLIGILLKIIEKATEIQSIVTSFGELKDLLNRRVELDGKISDNRLPQVKEIESLIEGYLKENFPRVQLELEIPPPELKQVFSTAKIFLNDGVRDIVDTKGDGLKRSVTFALLRSLGELKKTQKKDSEDVSSTIDSPYLFLFEEPELYLHPIAQRIMFDALARISEEYQVIVTTHSPLFFSPNITGTFIKLIKKYEDGMKPYGHAITIDLLDDISAKDAFQIICFENSSAAFFASKVVLVEGDSDICFYRHLSKILNQNWDFDNRNIPIIRINGKGNVKRFKDFFEKFEIDVHCILDLDVILGDFDKLEQPEELMNIRHQLIECLDRIASEEAVEAELSRRRIKSLIQSYSFKQRYERLKEIVSKVVDGGAITQDEQYELDLLFSEEVEQKRRQVLTRSDISIQQKNDLIDSLFAKNIYILRKGTLENYYPPDVEGSDKPTRALNACKVITCSQQIKDLCLEVEIAGERMSEFEAIFNSIFMS